MKLVVTIEPGWQHGVHQVEVELGDDYEDYRPEEIETAMAEIAEDTFNEHVSYGWKVVNDDDDKPKSFTDQFNDPDLIGNR